MTQRVFSMVFLIFSSLARGLLALATLAHGVGPFYALIPSLIIPILKKADFYWSQEPIVLQRPDGKVIYHNYTLYHDEEGHQRGSDRWT
jgi:hypothetical protein